MRRASLFFCLALLATLCVASAIPGSPAQAAARHKVVLQWTEVDSLGQWVMTKHVGNMLDDLGDQNVDLEVLTYGPAVFAVTKTRPQTKFADEIAKLTQRGVKFRVCHHAMDILGVKEDELLPTVQPVRGAMSEMVEKHEAGYQILKP